MFAKPAENKVPTSPIKEEQILGENTSANFKQFVDAIVREFIASDNKEYRFERYSFTESGKFVETLKKRKKSNSVRFIFFFFFCRVTLHRIGGERKQYKFGSVRFGTRRLLHETDEIMVEKNFYFLLKIIIVIPVLSAVNVKFVERSHNLAQILKRHAFRSRLMLFFVLSFNVDGLHEIDNFVFSGRNIDDAAPMINKTATVTIGKAQFTSSIEPKSKFPRMAPIRAQTKQRPMAVALK